MFKRITLLKEIIAVLLIKAILLYGIWQLFFANPGDRNLDGTAILHHLIDDNADL